MKKNMTRTINNIKKYAFTLVLAFFPFLFLNASDAELEKILADRKNEINAEKKEYSRKVEIIDGQIIEKLADLLRKKITDKDFNGAKSVKKAIASLAIQEEAQPVSTEKTDTRKTTIKPQQKSKIKTLPADGSFPKGSFRQFGRHYCVLPFKMNFHDAQKACEALGGHMLNIKNEEEYNFFHDYAVRHKKTIWLDLSFKNGKWTDWQGNNAAYLKWFEGKYKVAPNANSVAVNASNSGSDMVRLAGFKHSNFAVCEWDK